MRVHFLFTALLIVFATHVATAQDRAWLGKARLFTNDQIGDGQDRWRTGSYSVSAIRGSDWRGTLPDRPGSLMEYRFRSEIIAPANLANPVLGGDRRYVGAISLGTITHFKFDQTDVALGLDMIFTGPQTGLGDFQSRVHRAIGMPVPKVLGTQIPNAFYPTVNIELGKSFSPSPDTLPELSLRPFIEAQAGVEDYIRIGGDLTFGNAGTGGLLVRDPTTGYRNIAVKGEDNRGLTFLLGADLAYVGSSAYLPTSSGYSLTNPRARVRAGVYSETRDGAFFYGLTWLGREFKAQSNSQVVGSVSIRLNF